MKKILVTAGLVLCLLAGACGKMSITEPLPDTGYPHSYPRQ